MICSEIISLICSASHHLRHTGNVWGPWLRDPTDSTGAIPAKPRRYRDSLILAGSSYYYRY